MSQKNFLRFILSIFFLSSLLIFSPTNVYAADTWIYSEDRNGNHFEYYLDLERLEDTVKPGFCVPAKTVKNGELFKSGVMHFFVKMNSKQWYWEYTSSSVSPSLVNEGAVFQILFDACIPYSDWAKRYPR